MPNRIKLYREKAGLTQQKLAEAMDSSVAQVSRLEAGKRKLTQQWLVKLTKALGVPPALILDAPSGGPNIGEFVYDRSEISLLRFWRGLDDTEKALFLKMLGAPQRKLDNAA